MQSSRLPEFQVPRVPGFKVPSIKVLDFQGSWLDSATTRKGHERTRGMQSKRITIYRVASIIDLENMTIKTYKNRCAVGKIQQKKSCNGSSKRFLQGSEVRIPAPQFQKGIAVFNFRPAPPNLRQPSTLSSAGNNSKEKYKQNKPLRKFRSCLHIGSGKAANGLQQSSSQISNITTRHINQSKTE